MCGRRGRTLSVQTFAARAHGRIAMIDDLRAILGEGPSDDTLQSLLSQTGGDVSAAANRFFDGGPGAAGSTPYDSAPPPPCDSVSDDVMATLFKTLEDVGRKLAGAPARIPACQSQSSLLCPGHGRHRRMRLTCSPVSAQPILFVNSQNATSSLTPPQKCVRCCSDGWRSSRRRWRSRTPMKARGRRRKWSCRRHNQRLPQPRRRPPVPTGGWARRSPMGISVRLYSRLPGCRFIC